MTYSQTLTRHELIAFDLSLTLLQNVNVKPRSSSATPELLVAAAWSVVEARWFYRDEVNFFVMIDGTDAAFRVRASVGPEVSVEDVLHQLERQIGIGHYPKSDLSQKFSILYEKESAKNKNTAIMLDCAMRGFVLEMTIGFSEDVEPEDAKTMRCAIQRVIQQLTSPEAGPIMLIDLNMISEQDLVETWKRNSTVPPAVKTPVHRLFQLKVREQPEAEAVCARDGSFTYKELDDLATRVAAGLSKRGVKTNVVVPLYFTKSKWMPVAILAVLKAGGAFLQLARSIPRGRIEAILSTDKPPFALVGVTAPSWLREIVPTCCLHELLAQENTPNYVLPECSPDQEAVRLFTSGSTGRPKGIVWTHATLASNCKDIRDRLSMGPKTRLFQTASYEFDVSMMETIAVLTSGGCLCIPLEDEGVNCSPIALEVLQGNTVYLTPTIARALDPDTVPTLKHLALEGEILPKDVVSRWAGKVTMYNFYGPAEGPHAASCVIDPESFCTGFAGSSAASLRWVVNPHNHEQLVPPGAIGELLIEGPILMDRYVGHGVNPYPFVTPGWLQCGCTGFSGRQSRLYKTGDLVRCNRDGEIVILGRKDTQVQICAERVELAEVEHHVRGLLTELVDVVAEIITPIGHGMPVLAAFLAVGNEAALFTGTGRQAALQTLTKGLEALAERVPQTFIPAVYIAVGKIPVTAAGKTNRRELRELGGSMTLDEISRLHWSSLGEQVMLN